jgi:tetratricopeptide (TPR) repeat protein
VGGLAAILLLGRGLQPAEANTVLRSGASHTEYVTVSGKPYRPHQSIILQADRLCERYKLQAAEALYKLALSQNHQNPGALNGLGKIAYYKTTSSNRNWRDQTDELRTEAIDHFMAALRYQPGYVEAHVNLASVYMEENRLGEAADELYRALRLSPQNAEALARRGEWLVRNQQANEAIPYLKKAIKLNSANVTAHYYLGVAQAERNEADAALQNLNTALWLQPQNGNAHLQLGIIYEKQGNATAAVEHYKKAIALNPELEAARNRLADYYQRQGNTSLALEQLKTIFDSTDPSWTLTDRVAKLSMENNQPEQAVKIYRKYLQSHPDDAPRANNAISLAKTQLAVKKLRDDNLINKGEAHRYAEQAMKYQPNNVEARMIKAKLDREIGALSPLKSREPGVIDAALSQNMYQPYQNFEKGELLLARYQFREAEQAFRAARRSGDSKRNAMQFGELFLAKGLPVLAEESFKHVLGLLPENASARLGLGKAREAREQSQILVQEARMNHKKNALPVAILLLERSLRENIENSQAHYLLAEIYEKSDDYPSAADHYFAYLQLEPLATNAHSVRRKIEMLKHKALDQREQSGSGSR